MGYGFNMREIRKEKPMDRNGLSSRIHNILFDV